MARSPFIYTGTTALVTGASTGIGAEFARSFAARGANVVLVARSEDKLDALAAEITASHAVHAHVLAADLSAPDAAAALVARLDDLGIHIDILVNNAGFGTFGDLVKAEPATIESEVALNVGALTNLTTLLLPHLLDRPYAAIINVASNAAFQAIPHMAVYAATKAYVLSFTRALWGELRGTAVRATAVCPGPTETPFFAIAGDPAALGARRTTAQVVATGLRALDRGKPSVVDGLGNAFVARVATRLTPERLLIAATGRYVRPRA